MKILFIGDMMCHDKQLMTMKTGDTYDFTRSFSEVNSVFGRYDHVVGNLETVLTDGPYNGFPKFSSPKCFAGAIIEAGVDCFMLANNHICDMGAKGVKSTTNYLESNGVLHTGAAVGEKPLPVFIGDVAIINYTNTMNVKADGVVYNDLTDMKAVSADVEYARSHGARVVIMVAHWGKEYETTHSYEQEREARSIVKAGVDAIVGSHPHVIQDRRDINGLSIIFSMGNFISSQPDPDCTESIGVVFEICGGRIVRTDFLNFTAYDDNGIIKVKETE